MRECMNWVSVTAFISASPAADNYRVAQLWAKVVSPRIAQRQAINSTLLFCRHAMLVPSIVAHAPCVLHCCHRRPSLPGGCCILPGTVCRRQYVHRCHYQLSTEDWRLNFCPVLHLFCLMNVSLYWLLRDPILLLRVLAVLGLYATSSQFVIIIIIIIIICRIDVIPLPLRTL